MKQCDRTWQAEAAEDGRLDDRDRSSFERHAASCADCQAEVASLRSLRERMLALDAPPVDELTRRRLRGEILRRANAAVTAAPSRRTRAAALALGLAAAAALALAWPRKAPPSRFEVIDVASAAWRAESVGATTQVTLDAGSALFRVEKLRPEARFVVRLPDGEIEVRGTRFVVDVEGGKTRSVVVSEGLVALRLGGSERLLAAGDRWPAPDALALPPAPPGAAGALSSGAAPLASALALAPAASALAQATPLATPPGEATPPDPRAPEQPATPRQAEAGPQGAGPTMAHPGPASAASAASAAGTASAASAARGGSASAASTAGATGAAGTASAASPSASGAASAVSAASARFAEAMAAFSGGDYGRADGLFAAFLAEFPRDGRAEDASFLRVQCRVRRGDKAGAAALARQYLRSFPRGLRRPEAERLAEPLGAVQKLLPVFVAPPCHS